MDGLSGHRVEDVGSGSAAEDVPYLSPARMRVYRAVLAATDMGRREVVGRLAVAGLNWGQVGDLLRRLRDHGVVETYALAHGNAVGGRRMVVTRLLPGIEPLSETEWSLHAPKATTFQVASLLWESDNDGHRRRKVAQMNEEFLAHLAKVGARCEDDPAAAKGEVMLRRPPPITGSGCSSATSWSVGVE